MSRIVGVSRAPSLWLSGATVALLLATLVAVVALMAPATEGRINPTAIAKEKGQAYVVTLAPLRSSFYLVRGPAVGQRAAGTLVLFEEGRALGPADAGHDGIRAKGLGAYSYWNTDLYFSSSDNSDPRSNGRLYSFRAQAEPRKWVVRTGQGAAIAALLMAIGWLRASSRSGVSSVGAVRLGRSVGSTIDAVGERVAVLRPARQIEQISCVGLAGLAAVAILLLLWHYGVSGHLGAASLLPVSDAMGYFRCALMGAEGSAHHLGAAAPGAVTSFGIAGEWCSRRSIWPLTMTSILFAGGWHVGIALLTQAFLVGAALGLLVVSAWRTHGIATGVLIAWLGGVFAVEWAVGTFMTENWGLVAGFTGAALLVEHARQRHAVLLALGLALLSVALAARAGALFVLPLLLLWGYVTLLPPGRRWSVFALVVPVAGLAAGPLLQWAGAHHFVADASNTGGNFGPSLYGLSTGSRDWSQAYRDFAPLFAQKPEAEVFKLVQQRALENIAAQPGVFVDSLIAAAQLFRSTLFGFGPGIAYVQLLTGLLVVGLLYCVYRWRDPRFSLPLLVFAAECLAAPLIVDSGGQRVFAATVWVRPLLVGIGIAALMGLALRLLRARQAGDDSPPHLRRPWAAVVMAGVVLLMSGLPLLLPSGALRPAPVAGSMACAPGEIPAIARVGRESMAMTVATEQSMPLRGPLAVPPGRVESDARWQGSWWSNGMGSMSPGSTVLIAFDSRPEARGQLLSLFSDRPLPPSAKGVYRLCAGEQLKRTLGDFPLRALTRVEAIDQQSPAALR